MDDLPLVSVIIPAHNAESTIRESMESALGQTHKNIEVIVIVNGCTDRTEDIARSLSDKRLSILSAAVSNASHARNLGLTRSKGAYIQYLDADDLLAPDKIALGVQAIRQQPDPEKTLAISSYSNLILSSSGEYTLEQAETHQFAEYPNEPIRWLLNLLGGFETPFMAPLHAWLIPRLNLTVGSWNEALSTDDDGEYITRIILASRQIVYTPTTAAIYRRAHNTQSLSRSASATALVSRFLSTCLKEARISQHIRPADPGFRLAMRRHFSEIMADSFNRYPDLATSVESYMRLRGYQYYPSQFGTPRGIAAARLLGWKNALRLRALRQTLSGHPPVRTAPTPTITEELTHR